MSPQSEEGPPLLLSAHQLARSLDGAPSSGRASASAVAGHQLRLWQGISFGLRRGDIVFVRGPSGVGKTLLLRAVAGLDALERPGTLLLRGQAPSQLGMPGWRAEVCYVHQQRVNFGGTPRDLLKRALGFAAQRARHAGGSGGQQQQQQQDAEASLAELAQQLGLDAATIDQPWAQLSGGQAQRLSLAVSIALGPSVLLLDEPTSACDHEAALLVEAAVRRAAARGCACLWVTHDDAQPHRVGGKALLLPEGVMSTLASAHDVEQGGPGSSASAADAPKLERRATWAAPVSLLGSFIGRRQQ